MVRIWKQGGWIERVGVIVYLGAFFSVFFDIVDFDPLPKTLDKLTIALPGIVLAFILVLGGQRLRFRAESREREKRCPPPRIEP